MSDKKLWEQYVALEKERDTLRSGLAESQYGAAVANDTIKALQAKVEQMERQEPVGKFIRHPSNGLFEQDGYGDNPDAMPLYALPGAQPTPSVPELIESLRCACNYIDKLGGVSQQYRAMIAAAPEARQ